jgi:CheY-like chemotaxis protein
MLRILLVDDDDALRTVLRLLLIKMEYEVVEAKNGREAMALFDKEGPDLVITDLVMPEKDGVEVIRDLRRKRPDLKIIAMSGGGRASAGSYLKIAKAMGASIVLAKPFSHDEMRAAISQLLNEGTAEKPIATENGADGG